MMKFLLGLNGVWTGTGIATYPPTETQSYREQLTFQPDDAQTVLRYEQKAWRLPSEEFLFWETGFVCPLEDSSIDLINAQKNGRVEVMNGSLTPQNSGFTLSLTTALFGNDPRMIEARREFHLDGATLRYQQWIATQTYPEVFLHLEMTLGRTDAI
jgi:hypothetical protein